MNFRLCKNKYGYWKIQGLYTEKETKRKFFFKKETIPIEIWKDIYLYKLNKYINYYNTFTTYKPRGLFYYEGNICICYYVFDTKEKVIELLDDAKRIAKEQEDSEKKYNQDWECMEV